MTTPDPLSLAPALLAWWDVHGRKDLPWQQDVTPYRVWVSEIMLQQTQVSTVLRYFPPFIAAFPDVVALADASLDRVLHRWSGLGYYARARHLHRAACLVRDQQGGQVPRDFAALASLPGIGRSTAGAILALSTGQRHPILDGNAKRVLARVFGVEGYPGESRVSLALWALAEQCTPAVRVAHYTQAVMDLGASLCARTRPACERCPLQTGCVAHRQGTTGRLPAARPARARPTRTSVLVLCMRADGAVLLEQRAPDGIWGGLWGLPEVGSVAMARAWATERLGLVPDAVRVRPPVTHGFTHFKLKITPVELRLPAWQPLRVADGDGWLWYGADAPAEVGLAAPVARLLAACLKNSPEPS